ncbi:hypothetical protein CAPTEDRAFT_186488 [Capitella teleta]|uniref:Uncharacterized protein n=1 Tax=Capitella teleta TaxID=283909 RepID=R7TWR0_CAPTE|nr:hypothetical protein CAPTEDRAFT_186488 [Capitella teleta]|eukprot:ELT98328.1 hypothetical protein CAPTEDRAFT_186488 [Capitella teleta]
MTRPISIEMQDKLAGFSILQLKNHQKVYDLIDEYWINEDDDKEPDSDDDCDCDLELLRPPAVTTLGLLSQATRTEGVKIKIKTWMIIEGTVSTVQCDTLKIGIVFSADGSNCLLRLIARQFRCGCQHF